MVKKLLFSSLFLTIISILPQLAHADYKGNTMTATVLESSSSLFPRHFYTMELFNNPQISESKFTLRLASYGIVSGCATTYGGTNKQRETFGTLKLSITDSELMLDQDPRYTNYDCEVKQNRSFTDVALDRDHLISQNIKNIKLISQSYGNFATLALDITKERIEISVNSTAGNFMTTFWFFPKDTVILHVPNAKLGQNIQKLIKTFGTSRGLTPMENNFKKFELPYNANSYAFFKDTNGDIINQLSTIGENVEIGKLITTRTIYDSNGPKEDPYSLPVFATLPGKVIIEKEHDY